MRTYRLAILECGTPIQPVRNKLGSYGKIFEKYLEAGLKRYCRQTRSYGVDLKITKINAVKMKPLPDEDQVDCVVLTPSSFDAFGEEPWMVRLVDYIRELHQGRRIVTIGFCFGHQIIGRAMGGLVRRNTAGWEVSVSQIDMTPAGCKLFDTEKIWLHQMHQNILVNVPQGVDILGNSPLCEIQGLYLQDRVLSLQAHPEFKEWTMSTVLEAHRDDGTIDDQIYRSGMERFEDKDDGVLISTVIWRFLLHNP